MFKIFVEFLNSLDFIEFLKSFNESPSRDWSHMLCGQKVKTLKKKKGSSTVTNSIKTLNMIHIWKEKKVKLQSR